MLELINQERTRFGVLPVVLGANNAAQLHAEASLQHCFSSHWGINGLKPYMRYTLAGGYQSNGENGSGSDYCIQSSDGYRAIQNIRQEIRESMDGWMGSPGHRRNILQRGHKRVNIGVAWDKYNFYAYQHFEGDYVEYDQLPSLEGGVLTFSGQVTNGALFDQTDVLDVTLQFDPPPHPLTRGQLSRTYCYDSGLPVAYVRKPLSGGWYYNEDEIGTTYSPCPNPYKAPPEASAPTSHAEAHEYWRRAHEASQLRTNLTVQMLAVTASEWKVGGDRFSITADLGKVLDVHGPGVYTMMLWGSLDGEDEVISEYSIFHGVEPPAFPIARSARPEPKTR